MEEAINLSIVNPTIVDRVLENISAVLFDATTYTEMTQFWCNLCLVVYGSITCKRVHRDNLLKHVPMCSLYTCWFHIILKHFCIIFKTSLN